MGAGRVGGCCSMRIVRIIRIFRGIMIELENIVVFESFLFFLLFLGIF